MTLGQVLLFDQLTIKLSKKNNKLRRRTKVKSPDWPLMPGQRPPSHFAFFSTIDSPGEKNTTFLEPPTKSTPQKRKPKKLTTKAKIGNYLAASHILGPAPQLCVPASLLSVCPCFRSCCCHPGVIWSVPFLVTVIRVLYDSFIVIPGVPYMTHLLPKVSARFVHHWPSSA